MPEKQALVCRNRHTFDVAREGYVNLLVGRRKSGFKGDTPVMLAARRRFLEAGHYGPLRQRLTELAGEAKAKVVAEVGCGEGYYVGGISEALPGVACLGTDIAKDGVRMAARRYPYARFAVADTNDLVPLPDDSVDVLLDVFAPRNAAEFARVLKPRGRLLVVIPTVRHLAELREIQPLLAIQANKRAEVERTLAAHFRPESTEVLTVPLKLNGLIIADLVGMTPNAWFLDETAKTKLAVTDVKSVTAEFELLQFVPIESGTKAV